MVIRESIKLHVIIFPFMIFVKVIHALCTQLSWDCIVKITLENYIFVWNFYSKLYKGFTWRRKSRLARPILYRSIIPLLWLFSLIYLQPLLFLLSPHISWRFRMRRLDNGRYRPVYMIRVHILIKVSFLYRFFEYVTWVTQRYTLWTKLDPS